MNLKQVPELKNAILDLPSKEKDKLLLRLINKDETLVEHLHFQLLEDENDLIDSAYAQMLEKDGQYISIQIFKLSNTNWTLEIVTPNNTSLVWDEEFTDDEVAFKTAIEAINEAGGILEFIELTDKEAESEHRPQYLN